VVAKYLRSVFLGLILFGVPVHGQIPTDIETIILDLLTQLHRSGSVEEASRYMTVRMASELPQNGPSGEAYELLLAEHAKALVDLKVKVISVRSTSERALSVATVEAIYSPGAKISDDPRYRGTPQLFEFVFMQGKWLLDQSYGLFDPHTYERLLGELSDAQ
jgi:hypothetical protein